MKIITFALLLTTLIILFGFKTQESTVFKVELSPQDWSNRYVWVTSSIDALKKSNLPTNQVLPLCDSLQKFANELVAQLQPQFTAQAKADSAQKTKNK